MNEISLIDQERLLSGLPGEWSRFEDSSIPDHINFICLPDVTAEILADFAEPKSQNVIIERCVGTRHSGARGCGFLTKQPSKHAQILLRRMGLADGGPVPAAGTTVPKVGTPPAPPITRSNTQQRA